MLLKNKTFILTAFIFTFNASSVNAGIDMKKLMEKLKQNAQQNTSQNVQATSQTKNAGQSSNGNSYQSKDDPSREAIKKQSEIRKAKKSGTPATVSETVDGQERLTKEDVFIEAISKAVRTVHPDINIPGYHHFRTYSEFQKNIASPKYGLIQSVDKVEKENVYSVMGQPNPSKNTWSVTAKAIINTKLSPENLEAIADDQRIVYAQGFGATADAASKIAALTAVQQYHQINLMGDSPFARNFMTNGSLQKLEVISNSQDKFTNLFVSKVKVTLADLSSFSPEKLNALKSEIEISKVKEQPNPVLLALADATKDVGNAQSIIENALSIKGRAELIMQDALREKTGIRFGQNDFQQQVGMNEERWGLIQDRLKENPKLDEQQLQEFKKGQSAMIAASLKMLKSAGSIFTSLSSGGNPFQSLQAMISFPQMMAVNSDGINSVMTYNSNNGIDNKEMQVAKNEMGD